MKSTLKSLRKRMPERQREEYDQLTTARTNTRRRSFTSITVKGLSLPGVIIHPLRDLVLVEYEEVANETKGGILIPSTAQTRQHGGAWPVRILAVGPGRYRESSAMDPDPVRIPMNYKPGDRAMAPCLNFPMYMNGREVYLTREDQLLGRLD